jgi:hypothetical protein
LKLRRSLVTADDSAPCLQTTSLNNIYQYGGRANFLASSRYPPVPFLNCVPVEEIYTATENLKNNVATGTKSV